MIRLLLAAFAFVSVLAQPALAGPLNEAKAKAHLDAVAAGDLAALMRDYADDAYMDWIGGPLDGLLIVLGPHIDGPGIADLRVESAGGGGGARLSTTAARSVYAEGVRTLNGLVT